MQRGSPASNHMAAAYWPINQHLHPAAMSCQLGGCGESWRLLDIGVAPPDRSNLLAFAIICRQFSVCNFQHLYASIPYSLFPSRSLATVTAATCQPLCHAMNPDKDSPEAIVLGKETPGGVARLSELVKEAPCSVDVRLRLLLHAMEENKTGFVETLCEWGNESDAFQLLVRLFGEESQSDEPPTGRDSIPCQCARKLLEKFQGVVGKTLYGGIKKPSRSAKQKQVGLGNLLHAVCYEGVSSIAAVVLESMDDEEIQELVNVPDGSNKRPIRIAMDVADDELVELFAQYDDGKRDEYILSAIEGGQLKFLQLLMGGYDDKDKLSNMLTSWVFNRAVERNRVEMWRVLTEAKQGDAAKQVDAEGGKFWVQLLAKAVEFRRVGIVRFLLDDHPEILQSEEFGATVKKAVHMSKGEDIESHGGDKITTTSEGDKRLSYQTADMLLDSMVRILDPEHVKACWPKEKGIYPKQHGF